MIKKTLKHKFSFFSVKAVAVLLCFCMLTGAFGSFFISASAMGENAVSVFCDNKKAENLQLKQNEKLTLNAVCNDKAESYCWQVLADVRANLWVDIYKKTDSMLTVSAALLSGVLDESGSAYVRAVAKYGGQSTKSDPVCVTVTEVESVARATAYYAPRAKKVTAKSGIISVAVNYLDAITGVPIYTEFSAQIAAGNEHIQIVDSPTYLGYKPFYNPSNLAETDPEKCTVTADAIRIHIPDDYSSANYTVNVYYKAVKVAYAAKYYFQNIGDDFYTEDSSLYKMGMAETGTIITDDELAVDRVGFTKLYHYPQAVAGDGSTVFECYYDRNYSMLKFNLDGGWGQEPIYARYGTPIAVSEPQRAGYIFKGWVLEDSGDIVDVPDSVPADSRTYRALWEVSDTSYTIVYRLQNADDDDYSYIGTETRIAKSGDTIAADDTLKADTPICGNIGARSSHSHSDDCYAVGFEHYIYDKQKTESVNAEITVKGDGSSILNIYYTRRYYTLRFIYAKEYNPEFDVEHKNWYPNAKGFSIVGGSTYGFGNPKAAWPNGNGKDYDLSDLMRNLKTYGYGVDQFGKVNEKPTLKSDKYTTGVYPEEGKGYDGHDYDYYGDRYHYFDITARYGADLSDLWPTDVFNPIEVPKHSQAANYYGEGEWGRYAYLAGWNGEFKTNYSLQKSNTTIKGLYQKLDSGILFGSLDGNAFSYTDDTKIERKITTTATEGGKTVESYLNYYLAFFNNGAEFSWNIPREWNYEYYVPVLDGDLTEEQQLQIKASDTPIKLENGLTYYYYKTNATVYRLGAYVVTSDDNRNAASQTQCALVGFEFDYSSGLDNKERSELIRNADLPDKRESYTLRMFYKRKTHIFGMYNYNSYYQSYPTVPFKTELDTLVLDADGNAVVPDYPTGIEQGAYTFGGWYMSPDCVEGTEYIAGSLMPDGNETVYGKWLPNYYTVNLFTSYDEMLAFESGDDTVIPYETRTVAHGSIFGSVVDPSNTFYDFSGWFYMKNGEKTAYTPLDIPIKSNLNIYAEWNSNTAQPYAIYYALEARESASDWLSALSKAAGAAPQNNRAYRVSLGTQTRDYIYLASDGGYHLQIAEPSVGYAYQGNMRTFTPKSGNPFNRLYDGYNNGYYPTVSSHSIAIAYEEDKDNPVHNIYTFTYVHLDKVDYRVEYRYKDTNLLIDEQGVGDLGSGISKKTTSMGVVTERFAPVTDYIADAFYKKLVIAVEWDEEKGEYVGSRDNVVTFYYTKNSESTYYAVHHMLEEVDGGGYTESTVLNEGIAKIGNTISIEPTAFDGFSVESNARLKIGNSEIDTEISDGKFTFTVDKSGSELFIYYKREQRQYSIYYLLDGTDISDFSTIAPERVLAPTVSGSGKYGETVTADSKAINGYTCTTDTQKSIVLRGNKQNYIVFFYTPLSYNIQYKQWYLGGGSFDVTVETGVGGFTGSTPKADSGYTFEGWFYDEECTKPVTAQHTVDSATGKLTPIIENLNPQPKTNIFYAKFMPAFGKLTVKRTGIGDKTETFVYKITSVADKNFVLYVSLCGNDSVTVKNLPIGNYTVEQQNDWSWRYDDTVQNVTIDEGKTAVAQFGSAAVNKRWLNGDSKPVKNRRDKR